MPGPVSATLTAKAIGDGGAHTYLSGVCELDRFLDEISHRRRGLNGIAIQCNVRGRTPVVHWCFTALTSVDPPIAYFSTTWTWRSAARSSARSAAGDFVEVVERCRSIQVPAWTCSART